MQNRSVGWIGERASENEVSLRLSIPSQRQVLCTKRASALEIVGGVVIKKQVIHLDLSMNRRTA